MSETRPPTDGANALATNQPIREAHVTIDERDFETIGIEGLLALLREAGVRDFEAIACHGNGAVVQVEVEHSLPADRLESLGSVDRWERVGSSGNWTRYVVEFTAPEFPGSLAVRRDDLIGTCDPELTDQGVAMSLVGPQSAIAEVLAEYENAGMSPELRRLGSYEGRESAFDALTDRQRDVLTTAYEMGYYEVPRKASTLDVAAELGIDDSTVTEHLQRAEHNLLARYLRD